MSEFYVSPYGNPNPYVPASLSEIRDQLTSMVGNAPTFVDESGVFPERNIDTEFHVLVEGYGRVRAKLGEGQHASLVALAELAKALFAADPEESNGKADQGIALLYEMEDVIRSVTSSRVKAKLKDEDGEVSGD